MDLRFWKKWRELPIPVEVREVVAKGAARLDAHRQSWWQMIDGDSLDMLSNTRCVLGQVYGSYMRGLNALDWSVVLNVEDYGFCPTVQPGSSELLKRAWIAEVAKRRAAAADASA